MEKLNLYRCGRNMKTLLQFELGLMESYLAENPSVSRSEYAENYPTLSRSEDWRKYLEQIADTGIEFPLDVCRDIARRFGKDALAMIAKYHPKAIPATILFSTEKIAA